MLRFLINTIVFAVLTVLTQIGGLAWVIATFFRRKFISFVWLYVCLSFGTIWVAPAFGRVALNCFSDGPLQMQNFAYCALNRHYVVPELKEVLEDAADEVDRQIPGTVTLVLDANFPFWDGFPLLPHLSHNDGEKADLAFYYRDERGYLPGATASPIGYFAFEQGPTNCVQDWPTLRWDLNVLQPLWPDYDLDETRNRLVLETLANDPRVGKIFVEPHLTEAWSISHPNIRFQGCRAARHDDHIHFQLR